MEAVKGNWKNSKNVAESALKRLIAVRSKEPQPTLQVLKRKIDELKNETVKFDSAQRFFMEKGAGKLSEEEITRYERDYEEVGDRIHAELDLALEMVHLMENPAPVVAPPTIEQSISNEKSSASRCKEIIESKLKKLSETLDDASTVHGVASLMDIKTTLESIRKMVYEEYVVAYTKLLELDVGNHDVNIAERDGSIQVFEETLGDIGLKISLKLNAVAPNTSPSSTAGGGSTVKSDVYFERRKFPSFDGKKRNFPTFKKEWRTCIQPSFGVELQLREIVKAVPKEIQPDIKNLKTMEEVWNILSQEYGRPRELVTESIRSLTDFQFSSKT